MQTCHVTRFKSILRTHQRTKLLRKMATMNWERLILHFMQQSEVVQTTSYLPINKPFLHIIMWDTACHVSSADPLIPLKYSLLHTSNTWSPVHPCSLPISTFKQYSLISVFVIHSPQHDPAATTYLNTTTDIYPSSWRGCSFQPGQKTHSTLAPSPVHRFRSFRFKTRWALRLACRWTMATMFGTWRFFRCYHATH